MELKQESSGNLAPHLALRYAIIAVLAMTVCRALLAWITPAVQDEAYYFLWAQHLDFGYFDHPPLVAWLASLASLLPGSTFAARLGTVLFASFYSAISARLLWSCGVRDKTSYLSGLLLLNAALLPLAAAHLVTPDSAMLPLWAWALLEARAALAGSKWRWLSAGVATGIGLLAKYTTAILGPVFLWALIKGRPEQLRTPWPYLGGILAFAIFSPNIIWNMQHDNITFKFQMRHGLSLDRPATDAALPEPLTAEPGGPELQLAAAFEELIDATEEEEKRPAPWAPLTESLNRYLGYYGAQFAFWGLLAYPVLLWLRRRWRSPSFSPTFSPPTRALLSASVLAPLLIFGSISLFGKAEANWSAMYLVGAAIWLAPVLPVELRLLGRLSIGNLILVVVVALHAAYQILPVAAHKDRILKETHGYSQLAAHLVHLEAPVFADTYQIASMLRHAEPALTVMQWPGITRYSEFTRRASLTPVTFSGLLSTGQFHLVTTNQVPPRIRGFSPIDMQQIRDCKAQPVQVINRAMAKNIEDRCRQPIHEWYLITYESF